MTLLMSPTSVRGLATGDREAVRLGHPEGDPRRDPQRCDLAFDAAGPLRSLENKAALMYHRVLGAVWRTTYRDAPHDKKSGHCLGIVPRVTIGGHEMSGKIGCDG